MHNERVLAERESVQRCPRLNANLVFEDAATQPSDGQITVGDK
jgi:hypothetical protein